LVLRLAVGRAPGRGADGVEAASAGTSSSGTAGAALGVLAALAARLRSARGATSLGRALDRRARTRALCALIRGS
jgi:hypothetical protein